VITGPTLTLRYATAQDAPRLMELASDPAVTRWFSWGPYRRLDEPEAYIAGLEAKREAGELLDFLVVHPEDGPIGVTGLSELSPRNRHATVGTWFGRQHWGSGANRESKAMIAALAFRRLGLDRLTAWANTRNGRSQLALERAGFRREGVLRDWHRHGDTLHDVVVFGLTRRVWERSPLAAVGVAIDGTPPGAFTLARTTEK
jgi:[ribosomal protein S5]-alanine N-acetyltransferase